MGKTKPNGGYPIIELGVFIVSMIVFLRYFSEAMMILVS